MLLCVAGGDYAVVCDCWGLWWRLCCCAVFFFQLCCVRLVGIMLLVYVKERLQRHVSDVEVDQVPTGMHGIMVRRVWSAGWVWHHGEESVVSWVGVTPQACMASW